MKFIRDLSGFTIPLLTHLEPEQAHSLTIRALKLFNNLNHREEDDPRLEVQALGLSFSNPVGLAAGFDKNAEVAQAMLGFGFGFVELGTVTPLPQAGNPRPRIFRLREDRAVINRLGFNNQGLDVVRERLIQLQARPGIRGINIGANKDTNDRVSDYVKGLRALGPLASYVTINISSPNTPGLRGLQNKQELAALLSALMAERAGFAKSVPMLVKIAPDLDEHACADIAELALTQGLDGLIVSNTTVVRPGSLKSPHRKETGGLSGAPLFVRSTEVLRNMHRLTGGKVTLIGVGGVSSGRDLYDKLKAGARLVQLYTALSFEGPALIKRLKRELLQLMERDGIDRVTAIEPNLIA